MDDYKRYILLSVCCVLSICHVIGKPTALRLPAKGGQSNDIIDDLPHTYDEAKSRATTSMRSKLAREKRGWIDRDPGNRATKTWTTVIIPNTPPEIFPSKTKTYVTTTSTITLETSSNKKPCCATTPTSASTKVHGQFVSVIVSLLVWKLFKSTDCLQL